MGTPFGGFEATLDVNLGPFGARLREAEAALDAFSRRINQTNAKTATIGAGGIATFGKFGTAIQSATKPLEVYSKALDKIGNIFTGGLGLAVAYTGLNSLTNAFGRGIEKAREFETGILSIAASQASSFKMLQGDKAITDASEAFTASLRLASEENEKILVRSTKNILSYREQLNAFLVAMPTAAKLGLSEKQQLELSENLAVAAKALGMQGQQITQQVRAVLGGANVQKTVLGSALGLTNAELKRMKEAGTVFDGLMDRTKGFQGGDSFFEVSIEGMLSQFENAIDVFLAKGGKAIAQAVKGPLKEIEDFLGGAEAEKLGASLGKIFANFLELLLKIAQSPAIPMIMKFLDFISRFGDSIVLIGAFVKIISLFQGLVAGGNNFIRTLQGIAQNALVAQAGLTGMAQAGQSAVGRGGNAPGRFALRPQSRFANYQDTAGRWRDTASGRFVSRDAAMRDQWLNTGRRNVANSYGPGLVGAPAASVKGLGAIRQNIAATSETIATGINAKVTTIRTSVAQQLSTLDSGKIIQKAGIVAMAYGLIDWVLSSVAEKMKPGGGRDIVANTAALSQGAIAGHQLGQGFGLKGGNLGIATVATAAISYLNTEAELMNRAASEAEQAEADLKAQLQKAPKKVQLKDKLRRLVETRDLALGPNGILSQKAIDGITDQIKDLNKQIKGMGGGPITRAKQEAINSMEETIENAGKALDFLPEGLNKSVRQLMMQTSKKLSDLYQLDDEKLEALYPGRQANTTRADIAAQIQEKAQKDLKKMFDDAANEAGSLGRELVANAFAVKSATREYNNFVQDIPQIREEMKQKVSQAADTYLSSLSAGSQVTGEIISVIQKRAQAEAETAEMSRRYGISQQTLLQSLYDFGDSTTYAQDATKIFADRMKSANDNVNGLRSNLDTVNQSLANMPAAIRSAENNLFFLGSAGGELGKRLSEAKADAEASFFARKHNIEGVQTQADLDAAVQAGKADTYIAEAKRKYAQDIRDQAEQSKQAIEESYKQEADFRKQRSELQANLIKAEQERTNVITQYNMIMSKEFAAYLNEVVRQKDALAKSEIASNASKWGTSLRDLAQQNEVITEQTAKLKNGIESAARQFQITSEKLRDINDQLASTRGVSNFAKALTNNELPIQFQPSMSYNIQVDASLKDYINGPELQGAVNNAIKTYVQNSCRNGKR